jgi:hypothetical protein
MIDKDGVLTYGKHKGEHWEWLINRHSDYLQWMVLNVKSINKELKEKIQTEVNREYSRCIKARISNARKPKENKPYVKTKMDIDMDIGCAADYPNFA